MEENYRNFSKIVSSYKDIVSNTEQYRKSWIDTVKPMVLAQLEQMKTIADLKASIEVKDSIENLEAVVLSLGNAKSGMRTEVVEGVNRDLIKHLGSLVYQQLFNGKIMVIINYPFIENYGQPNPPKTIAIYRPEELREAYCIRHMEEFIKEIANWEDYGDDDSNQQIGFKLNFDPSKG